MIQDEEVSSISGSGSDDSSDSDDIRREHLLLPGPEEEHEGEGADRAAPGPGSHRQQRGHLQVPQYVFKSVDNRFFAVWRCLLFQDHVRGQAALAEDAVLQRERLTQLCSPSASQLWVIIMLRGGHFAAAVLRRSAKAAGTRCPLLDPALEPFEVVEHKTFHRYVVRWDRANEKLRSLLWGTSSSSWR